MEPEPQRSDRSLRHSFGADPQPAQGFKFSNLRPLFVQAILRCNATETKSAKSDGLKVEGDD